MKINDLVRVYNDPIEGHIKIPEGQLGVLKEIVGRAGSQVKVQFPGKPILTWWTTDVSSVDYHK